MKAAPSPSSIQLAHSMIATGNPWFPPSSVSSGSSTPAAPDRTAELRHTRAFHDPLARAALDGFLSGSGFRGARHGTVHPAVRRLAGVQGAGQDKGD